jgi:hypothetical protein
VFKDEDFDDGVVGRGEGAVLLGADVDGVECAMYKFEALVIALVRRVVVPEMAWLECANATWSAR